MTAHPEPELFSVDAVRLAEAVAAALASPRDDAPVRVAVACQRLADQPTEKMLRLVLAKLRAVAESLPAATPWLDLPRRPSLRQRLADRFRRAGSPAPALTEAQLTSQIRIASTADATPEQGGDGDA